MARSLNKVQLIGNLTRDPEVKYTPSGSAVCTFSLATNRDWKTETGEKKEEVEFHRLVVWGKLAEICGQYLKRGAKAYFEGRIQSRKWQTKEGEERVTYEIVVNDMMMLDSKGGAVSGEYSQNEPEIEVPDDFASEPAKAKPTSNKKPASPAGGQETNDDDIPF